MNTVAKISPAFERLLAEGGPHDRQEAIVMYRPPQAVTPPLRGPLRALKERLDYVKAMAAQQQPFEAKLAKSYQRAGARQVSGTTKLRVESIGNSALPIASVEVTRQTLPELAKQKNVVAVMPNQPIRLIRPKAVSVEDLDKGQQKSKLTWGLERLGIPEIWETTKGAGINVAVIDTGVYGAHPALQGRVKEGNFVVIDPIGNRIQATPSFDSEQHGTHVCGTIAGGKTAGGVSIGVAPEANLFVAAALMGGATLLSLLEAMSWAVEKGADIISMSLGFTYYEPLFTEVFQFLIDSYRILPVVAIGNENHGNTSSPGNAYNAFSVGAVEKHPKNMLEIASFSSGASLTFPGDPDHRLVDKPDVSAPGVQVYSAIPPEKTPDGVREYAYMDGTSMATPHVAGAAALLMAARPQATVQQITDALKQTAWHPGGNEARPDNRWGYGMIQPVEALKVL